MLSFLPPWIKGSVAFIALCANTVLLAPALVAVAIARALLPLPSWRRLCTRWASSIAELWIDINGLWIRLTRRIDWKVEGLDGLHHDQWYLVTSNHQSWADIFILQYCLNHRVPLPKFFLKKQLIWVPVIGLCWWALDFPFMQRHSREYLERHPEKRNQDLESTRRACEKFQYTPVTIFNFVEGTRFTRDKHRQQQSPYRHLLKPKAGGVAAVLDAMGGSIHSLLDFTIAYQGGRAPSFWEFISGRTGRVTIHLDQREIPEQFLHGDYATDEAHRQEFQAWIRAIWEEKDALLDALYQRPVD